VAGALSAAGHIPGPLVNAINPRNLYAGISAGSAQVRYSVGYADIRHLAGVIVENHSLKTYRQRVLGTYVLLEASLRTVAQNADSLRSAVATDRVARPRSIPANWGGGDGAKRLVDFLGVTYETYASPASGRQEVRWTGQPKTYRDVPFIDDKPGAVLSRPKAYWVPVTKPEVIERLRLHGVQFETITEPRTLSLEMARLVKPVPKPGEGFHPFEGRYTITTDTAVEAHSETFPPGSIHIPTDQPLGDLVVVLLDPKSADSFLAWGFFPEILQRVEYIEGYVIAPLADRLLESNPDLKREFTAKLAADPKFAADPDARLGWFYARTRSYDERYLLYPVGIER
jgi:hypothetical protein